MVFGSHRKAATNLVYLLALKIDLYIINVKDFDATKP